MFGFRRNQNAESNSGSRIGQRTESPPAQTAQIQYTPHYSPVFNPNLNISEYIEPKFASHYLPNYVMSAFYEPFLYIGLTDERYSDIRKNFSSQFMKLINIINQECDYMLPSYGYRGKPTIREFLECIKQSQNPTDISGI